MAFAAFCSQGGMWEASPPAGRCCIETGWKNLALADYVIYMGWWSLLVCWRYQHTFGIPLGMTSKYLMIKCNMCNDLRRTILMSLYNFWDLLTLCLLREAPTCVARRALGNAGVPVFRPIAPESSVAVGLQVVKMLHHVGPHVIILYIYISLSLSLSIAIWLYIYI